MIKENIIWLAGLFEGEGTFCIHKEKYAKHISITSTDLDVLERIKEYFGGQIYKDNYVNKPDHWKAKFTWKLSSELSVNVVKNIYPYLLSRRQKRADFYLSLIYKRICKQDIKNQLYTKILDLSKTNKTHKEIGDIVGLERSSVSKILKINSPHFP